MISISCDSCKEIKAGDQKVLADYTFFIVKDKEVHLCKGCFDDAISRQLEN